MKSTKMMTVREAAERWGLSVRRVQELCKMGRVHGAVLFGKNWMIPADLARPEDGRGQKRSNEVMPLPRRTPLLIMTDLYHTPGTAAKASADLKSHPEARALFDAGIAYSRGDIDKAYRYVRGFLEQRSGFYAVTGAGLLLSFCAIWRGDAELWDEAMHHITTAPIKSELDRELLELVVTVAKAGLYDFSEYPDWFDRGNFEKLPGDSHPAAKVFSARYCFSVSYRVASRQMSMPGMDGLGLMSILPYTLESWISQAVLDKTVIPEIHLRLWCAIMYHNSGQTELAIPHIDKAIAMAVPDKLYGILAEHRFPFGRLLDDRLRLVDPALEKKVKELHRTYFDGRSALSRHVNKRTIAINLSTREREIAKLAAFGMTNKAIAKNLNISESTVKSTIQTVMQKTGLTDRGDFVLIL